jgi:predicted DNA binding CopG/RHH family protein
MGRTNHKRTEIPPVRVRLSPSELEGLKRKASVAGLTVSAAIRAAVLAWAPDQSSPAISASKAAADW